MGDRVTATLEDLHVDVIEEIKQKHGLGSDAAAVRQALELVDDLSDQLEETEDEVDRLQTRLEDRDREFRVMSLLVPVALGIDQDQMADMIPGMEDEDLPALPDRLDQNSQQQRGALKRFQVWLLGESD